MGQFAQMSLPLADSATLTIVRNGSFVPEIVTVRTSATHGFGYVAHTCASCLIGLASAQAQCRGPIPPPSAKITVLQSTARTA